MSSDGEVAIILQDFMVHNESIVRGELLAAPYPVPPFIRVNGKRSQDLTLEATEVKQRVREDLQKIEIEKRVLLPIAADDTPSQVGIVSLLTEITFELLAYLEETQTVEVIIQKDEKKAAALGGAMRKLDKTFSRPKEELDQSDLEDFNTRASESAKGDLERQFQIIDKDVIKKLGSKEFHGEIRKNRIKKALELARGVTSKIYAQAQARQVIIPTRANR